MAVAKLEIQVGFSVMAEELQKSFAKMGKNLQTLGRNLKKAGAELTRIFTVPIVGIATAAFASSGRATAAFEDFAARAKHTFSALGDEIASAIGLADWLVKIASGFDALV